ncbi:MAG: hypothetical protein COA58_08335 [Bacteroidetes bacterium]|nr:MAG: hypothetical protein COA58_08335 [Bacteroidota bacterium]
MKEILIKIASFLWDIPIEKTSSEHNDYLEVVWSQGKKMLNTKDANFSFGNGYGVFEKAIGLIEKDISSVQNTLILGFGCGSILHLLEKKHSYNGEITGIEYDPIIISLFKKHFEPNYSLKPELIAIDAFDFLNQCKDQYDLIFIDLFKELDNVDFIFTKPFISSLKSISNTNTILVFNTIKRTELDHKNISELILKLSRHYKNVSSASFQDLNQIIIAK